MAALSSSVWGSHVHTGAGAATHVQDSASCTGRPEHCIRVQAEQASSQVAAVFQAYGADARQAQPGASMMLHLAGCGRHAYQTLPQHTQTHARGTDLHERRQGVIVVGVICSRVGSQLDHSPTNVSGITQPPKLDGPQQPNEDGVHRSPPPCCPCCAPKLRHGATRFLGSLCRGTHMHPGPAADPLPNEARWRCRCRCRCRPLVPALPPAAPVAALCAA